MKKTYLVTGGAGFIGSHIVKALVKLGQKVIVLDNLYAGDIKNIEKFLNKIEFIKGDIRNVKSVKRAVKGCDYILHQAALRSVPKSVDNPVLFNEVNVTGTLNILIAARDADVRRVVFASSSSVYGESKILPQKESHLPCAISPYAVTKLTGEYYCRTFNRIYGLETVSLRYFNVFGPRQSLESEYAVVIPKFVTNMLNDEQPPVHGDGRQTRDFTYIDNVVRANLKAATKNGISGEVFNIACGSSYSVLDLIKFLNKILNKSLKPKFVPPRPGDVRNTQADIAKMKRLLALDPAVDFVKGLEKTVEYFKGIN